MRKVIYIFLITLLVISGCAKKDDEIKSIDTNSVGEVSGIQDASLEKDKEIEEPENGVFECGIFHEIKDWGSFHIKSYELAEGRRGKTNILFTLDFTNLFHKETTYASAIRSKLALYQNGERIDWAIADEELNVHTIVPVGETIEIVTAYELLDETSDIEFGVYAWDESTVPTIYEIKIVK